MTRKKVDPDKRKRVSQACIACKRSKLKCDGLSPCKTCSSRNKNCLYGGLDHDTAHETANKRRKIEAPSSVVSSPGESKESPKYGQQVQTPGWDSTFTQEVTTPNLPSITQAKSEFSVGEERQPNSQNHKPKSELEASKSSSKVPQNSAVVTQDEEADVYNYTRMLQDPTGRLLYLGDSASLSYLQLIRVIIEGVAGPSLFTQDPQRHRIVENTIDLPHNVQLTRLLPDKTTACILLEAYFINTSGLVELFNRKNFIAAFDKCYTNPLNVDPSWLCLLYLTFAIGLVMACPTPGTEEDEIIQKLRNESINRAEAFYLNARHLGDPERGFEDNGFWSIQALTLMSIYMLAVSKRNAAYAYYGMAVRSAFALGLHREETHCIFKPSEQSVRRNLWRSLFVLDRFLAASLGRPTAIRESDCSGDTLATSEIHTSESSEKEEYTNSVALKASTRSSHVIGVVLEKVYSTRKVSTGLAQEIANECKSCPQILDPILHWRQARTAKSNQGVAILHVNLLYCHSVILLTRPFLLYLMKKKHEESDNRPGLERYGTKMKQFAESCVVAGCHSIALIQVALDGGYLPRRNPFVIYFLFAAALVVLSNEFTYLYINPLSKSCVKHAIDIMRWCSKEDPQAKRLHFILTAFRDVVEKHHAKNPRQDATYKSHPNGTTPPSPNTTSSNTSPLQENAYPYKKNPINPPPSNKNTFSQQKSSSMPIVETMLTENPTRAPRSQSPYTASHFTTSSMNSPASVPLTRTFSGPNSLISTPRLYAGYRSSPTPEILKQTIDQPHAKSLPNTLTQLSRQNSFDLCMELAIFSNTALSESKNGELHCDEMIEFEKLRPKVQDDLDSGDVERIPHTVGVAISPRTVHSGVQRKVSAPLYGVASDSEGVGNVY